MSSSGPGPGGRCAALILLVGLPGAGAAQDIAAEPPTATAEAVLANARDVYYAPEEQSVSACARGEAEGRAENAAGNTIVVCRRLGPANELQTRALPRPRMDQTADGVPRAPDVSGLPPCASGGLSVCIGGLGSVPPPALIVDVTRFPEPLSPEHAARVLRAEDAARAGDAAPRRVIGERVPIPPEDPPDER